MTTLKAALQEACFMELEDIPSEEELSTDETLTFSPAFEKKMMKLIRRADHPIRYRIIRAAACVLLAAVLSGCTVLAFVPEARATFTRWVTEWYESHVVYRYAGGSIPEDLPRYGITELPEGFVESERIEFPTKLPVAANITYENESGDVIILNYSFMVGGAVSFVTEDSDIFDIEVNHMSGQFFESKIPGNFNTITWIDEDQNIQFDISGEYSYADILRMAESVQKKYFPVVLPRYEITEMPEGFAETSRVQVDRIILCTYTGPDGSMLFFSYVPMSDGIIEAVTTNGIEPEAVVINGMTGDFYLSNDTSETNELIWFDQNASMAFSLSSYFDKAVMMRMAKSVSLVKTKNENPELGEIAFDYLPDGMSEIGRDCIPQTHYQAIWFEDSMGRRFEISQDIMTSNKQSTLILDTEDAEATKIDFNGYDATLITKGEQTMLLCVDDDSCILLSGDFPSEEIIKIANGVNILHK